MRVKAKKNISNVFRALHRTKKSRLGYYTMERNERVDEFDNNIVKSASNIKSYDLRTYPVNTKIYDQLSKWLRIKKENLILTEGADGSLLRIFNVFVDKGTKVVALYPSFAMYPIYCKMFKAKYLPFKIKLNSKFNYFEEFVAFIKKHKPKIIFIANPNQPIEVMFNYQQLKKISLITKKMNTLFVIDEAYYHFNNITAKTLIKKFDNIIVVRTFSKAFGLAGLRIGYSIAHNKIIDYMRSIKPVYEINSLNIKILLFFLKKIYIMKKNVKQINDSRIYLKRFLKKFNIHLYGKYSNTVLLPFSNKKEAKNLVNGLYRKKFIVRYMQINNKGYIRCTLGSKKIIKKFTKEIQKILKK